MNLSILKRLNNVNFVAKRKFLVISLLAVPIFFLPIQSKVEAFSLNPIEIKQSVSGFYEELKESIMKKFGFGKENTETTVPVPEIGTETNDYHPTMREFHPEQQETPDPIDVQRMQGESSRLSGQGIENSQWTDSSQSKANREGEPEFYTSITKGENKEGKVDTDVVSTDVPDSQWDGTFKDPEAQERLDKMRADMEEEILEKQMAEAELENAVNRKSKLTLATYILGTFLGFISISCYLNGDRPSGRIYHMVGAFTLLLGILFDKNKSDTQKEWYNKKKENESASASKKVYPINQVQEMIANAPRHISFMDPMKDLFYENWLRNPMTIPDTQTVIVHASKDAFFIDGKFISAHVFAEMVRSNPNFEEGKPIMLFACEAGKDRLAQDFANYINADVFSGNKKMYALEDGDIALLKDYRAYNQYITLKEINDIEKELAINFLLFNGNIVRFRPKN